MQRNIRKLVIFAGLPLAVIALAVFLLSWGTGSGPKAHAAPAPGLNFDLSSSVGTGCNSDGVAKCNANANGQFTVAVDLVALGTAGPYQFYDASVSWSGNVNFIVGSLKQQGAGTWVDGADNGCGFPGFLLTAGTPTPVGTKSVVPSGNMAAGCAQGLAATANSSYTGPLMTMGFDCKSGGTGTITLLHGDSNTDIGTASPVAATYSESAAGTSESLTVNCVPATNTPLPTATSTPPAIPFVQKLPALQNVFLHRQGAKIPPVTCEAGTDSATLTETLGGPITSQDPKIPGSFQKLGAFEFEMRFDEKMVCVSVVAGSLFSGPAATCATVRAKGIVRFACFTVKKNNGINGPGALAVITVKPQPELYSQLRPNQDNGIPVQILNQGCQLSDEQGHSIPISSCEDADITFRFLEGDVVGPNCAVNAFDAQNIAMRWGANKGSLLFNSFFDLSPSGQIKGDGRIDIKDLQFVFGRLNSTCLVPWPVQAPVNPKAP